MSTLPSEILTTPLPLSIHPSPHFVRPAHLSLLLPASCVDPARGTNPRIQILALRPMWKNLFENSATVQADHRVLALTTTASALGMYWYARRGAGGGRGALWAALPAGPRAATTATAGIVTAQVRSRRHRACLLHTTFGDEVIPVGSHAGASGGRPTYIHDIIHTHTHR